MKILKAIISLAIIIVTTAVCTAQYSGPESVVFDYANDRYFVANCSSGKIQVLDMNYNPIDSITGQGACLGMCIVDNVLYVSCSSNVRGFDLDTFERVMNVSCMLAGHFDGQTSAGDGYLYVIDTGGWLIRIDLDEGEAERYMPLNMSGYPQDCVYDFINNRIVVVTWGPSSEIKAVDLADSSISTILPVSVGYWDGITIDDEGSFYLASHTNLGCIFKYDNLFANEPELISRGHDEPAGLGINNRDDILAVPNFGGNSVDFIPLATSIDDKDVLPDDIYLAFNYPNPFNGSTTIRYGLKTDSHVTIELYDILGRKLRELYEGRRSAGEYLLTWNADGYATGVYYCNIRFDDTNHYLRMTYIK